MNPRNLFAFLQRIIANTVRLLERKDKRDYIWALSYSQVMKKSNVYPPEEHSQQSDGRLGDQSLKSLRLYWSTTREICKDISLWKGGNGLFQVCSFIFTPCFSFCKMLCWFITYFQRNTVKKWGRDRAHLQLWSLFFYFQWLSVRLFKKAYFFVWWGLALMLYKMFWWSHEIFQAFICSGVTWHITFFPLSFQGW